jgi:hypothetical protein
MFDLEESANVIINFCNEGDLMSALSYFESEIRPHLPSVQFHTNQKLLDIMNGASIAIENEEWNTALEAVDEMSNLLNG